MNDPEVSTSPHFDDFAPELVERPVEDVPALSSDDDDTRS